MADPPNPPADPPPFDEPDILDPEHVHVVQTRLRREMRDRELVRSKMRRRF